MCHKQIRREKVFKGYNFSLTQKLTKNRKKTHIKKGLKKLKINKYLSFTLPFQK